MIQIGNKKITDIVARGFNISKVYHGSVLVWQKIKDFINSCYGSGKWIGNKKWISNDKWKSK